MKMEIFYQLSLLVVLFGGSAKAQEIIDVNWDETIVISKTTPTLQVVYNPMLKRGSPMHQASFEALSNLRAEFVRYVPWYPYPHVAVAELKPPTKDSTFWDFSYMDPFIEDAMNVSDGYLPMLAFSTIPVWMFKTEKPVVYPEDPDQEFWGYNEGKELRDTTMKEVADYFARVFSWYTKGGFTDELGKFHSSKYHYKIKFWEVLNEPEGEHQILPEMYGRIYDAVALAIKKIDPDVEFVGLSYALENDPYQFEYFLNPRNHKKGVPLNWISYHFYGFQDYNYQLLPEYQYTFFNKANEFLAKVRYIESIRKQLSPNVKTTVNEIGSILNLGDHTAGHIPYEYWNLSGALYAYVYLGLTRIGIDVAGQSQLVGYPSQFPSVSMMNWKGSGTPNARFRVLELIKSNFQPGDTLVNTQAYSPHVEAQGVVTKRGKKLLLINKRNYAVSIKLPESTKGKRARFVDTFTGDGMIGETVLESNELILNPFSVMVIDYKR